MFAFVKAFVAGILAVLTFHQGLLWGLDFQGVLDATPWDMTPVPPLGVPKVLSAAFFGGLWGMLLWLLIRNALAAGYYVGAAILGAILLTLVYRTVVVMAHGASFDEMLAGVTLAHVAIGMALNGVWGLGLAIFMRVLHPPR